MKKFVFAFLILTLTSFSASAENTEAPSENSDDAYTAYYEYSDIPSVRQADLYIYGNGVTFAEFPIIERDTLLLPLKPLLDNLISASEFTYDQDSENLISITYKNRIISIDIGSDTMHLNNSEMPLSVPAQLIDGTVYAPMRAICEGLGFIVKAEISNDLLSVYVDFPPPTAADYVNNKGLSSETPYLIWVNKGTYTVHVFLGSKREWNEIYSCKCAIGASQTPTITGTYKFFSLEKRWSYKDFYVGPIMRFHGGYAIHTTLLNYDGTDYNATVGKKLSHGCVRVRPNDMEWLVAYVPLKTTIYITEN